MEEEDSEIDSELFLLCRLCIMGSGKFAIVPKTQIHTDIRKIFGVMIEPYDGLSQLLCLQCKDKLMEIINMRATFVNNQEILAALRINHLQKRKGNLTIKTEPPDEGQDSTSEAETDDTIHSSKTPAPVVGPSKRPAPVEAPFERPARVKGPSETPDPVAKESTGVANFTTDAVTEKNKIDEAIKSEPNEENSGEPIENEADDMEYQYHCRLCNDKFQSVFKLKHHTKSHKKLIKLQKRYTPYTCSVRAHRIDGVSLNSDIDDLQFSHPLFFVRKCNSTARTDKGSSEVRENTCINTDAGDDASDNDMDVGADSVPENNSGDKVVSDDDMDMEEDFFSRNNTERIIIRKDNSDCRVDAMAEEPSKSEEESHDTSIFQSTIAYEPWSGDYSSTFGAIFRETVSVLENEEVDRKLDSFDLVDHDKISEIIQQRCTRYCRTVEEAQEELLIIMMNFLCKRKLKLIWEETKSNPEIILKHSPKNCSFNLDGFESVPDKPKPASMKKLDKLSKESSKQTNPGNKLEEFAPISEKPKPASKKKGAKVTKEPLKQTNTGNNIEGHTREKPKPANKKNGTKATKEPLKPTNTGSNLGRSDVLQEKPKPASKKTNKIMKEASKPIPKGSEMELDKLTCLNKEENYLSKTITPGSKILIKTATIETEITNGEVTSSVTSEVRPEEAGTGTNVLTDSEIESAAKEGNEVSTSDIGTNSQSEFTADIVELDTNFSGDNYTEDESMLPETNENFNESSMPLAETTMTLPIIVSTSTVDPFTDALESTSVYIDLEDAQHTVNSDHFQEPATPLHFFQHVLEKEGYILSVEKQTPQASPLVCYKKSIENRGDLVITISVDDIVFYLDVQEDKTNLDLTQENVVTQWLLLLSMTERKVETIMKNYAKRFAIDVEKIERFLKITRSISGTIRGEDVWMEAPNQFFF